MKNKGYDEMQRKARLASDEELTIAYKILDGDYNENSSIEVTLAYGVITSELEDRGLLTFDWEKGYVLTA